MTSSVSAEVEFVCNICGSENRVSREALGRETPSCGSCGSWVRTRAIVHMISREMFGADLALPDFPTLKAIRGLGISDSADYSERLAAKFDYRNTHYHKPPQFDITTVPDEEAGKYDFLVASEVFEHVAPPVERAFENAFRLLKPNGLFFFTVPYSLASRTVEHFPELSDFGIAQLRDRMVLVNRTREGELQVFNDLVFHGGGGSTLEMRVFNESGLREQFVKAGFRSIEIYSEGFPAFGVYHGETWSLPMTARKDPFSLDRDCASELVAQTVATRKRLAHEMAHKAAQKAEYEELVALAKARIDEAEKEVVERTIWAQNLEKQLNERTEWALSLEKELREHTELAKRFQRELEEQTHWALELKAQLEQLRRSSWTRAGRVLGFVKE